MCRNVAKICGCFGVVVLTCGLCLMTPSFAEQAASHESPASLPALTNGVDARVAALAGLSLEELRAKVTEIEQSIPKLAEAAQELAGEARELRIAAQNSDAVQAIRAEMAALQQKLEKTIDELPEVKAKADEAMKAKAKLFQEMQLRTRAQALIAAAERKAAEEGKNVPQDATDTVNGRE